MKLFQKHRSREELLAKVEKFTEIPMLVLVIIMMITLITPMAIHVSEATEHILEVVDWIIWAVFAFELLVKTYLSQNRFRYLLTHWIDVVVVIIPFLRIFRIFRVARLARGARVIRGTRALRLLRFARILIFFGKFTTEIKNIFSRYGFNYLLVVLLGLVGLGTVLTYNFDKGISEGTEKLADSFWLSVVAAFSGGFANVYPQTPEAKGISILLIVFGTVIVSFFTASLASFFTEKGQDIEQKRIEQKLDALLFEVKNLQKSTK